MARSLPHWGETPHIKSSALPLLPEPVEVGDFLVLFCSAGESPIICIYKTFRLEANPAGLNVFILFLKQKKQEATSKKRLMQPIVLLCTALQLTTLAGSYDFHARIHTYIHTYLPFGLCARHPVLNLCFPLLHDAEEIGNCQEKCCARIRKKNKLA